MWFSHLSQIYWKLCHPKAKCLVTAFIFCYSPAICSNVKTRPSPIWSWASLHPLKYCLNVEGSPPSTILWIWTFNPTCLVNIKLHSLTYKRKGHKHITFKKFPNTVYKICFKHKLHSVILSVQYSYTENTYRSWR